MPGPIPNTSGDDNAQGVSNSENINNQASDNTSNESNSQKTQASESNFDPKQIGDEDFSKVFDDPRLFTHSRFKQLNERAKKAAELEKQQEETERKKLKEQQKWQELAEKTEAEKAAIEAKYTEALITSKIQVEATKAGAVDTEAVAKLIDRGAISIDQNGNVVGVEEAIKAMQEGKKYLFGESQQQTLGNATNPGSDGNTVGRRFTLQQISDPVFYAENEQDILQAFKQGLISQ
jgi:membrane protein involved in colicin uptake